MIDSKRIHVGTLLLVGVVMLSWGGMRASALGLGIPYEPSRPAFDVAFRCGSEGLGHAGLRVVRYDPGAKLECMLRSIQEHNNSGSPLVQLPDGVIQTSLVGAVNEFVKLAANGRTPRPVELLKVYSDYGIDAYWAWWAVFWVEPGELGRQMALDGYRMWLLRRDDIVRFFVALHAEPRGTHDRVRYWVRRGLGRRTGVVARLVDMGPGAIDEVYGIARSIRDGKESLPWRLQADVYSTAVVTLAAAGDRRFLGFVDKPRRGMLTRFRVGYLRRRAEAAGPLARDLRETIAYFLLERSRAFEPDRSGNLRRWGRRRGVWAPKDKASAGKELGADPVTSQ